MRTLGVWSLAGALALSYSLFALGFAGWALLGYSSWLYMAAGAGLTAALGVVFLELEFRGLLAGAAGSAAPAPGAGCCR